MSKKIEILIESFSKKGDGVGTFLRGDGERKSVEVPFTVPGDRVVASLAGKRKGVFKSFLDSVVEPSAERIQPRCQHFEVCGGCRWQHLSYSQQLKWKENVIKHLFGENVRPIVPAREEWGYRNKMEFSFSSDAAGERYLGLMKNQGRMRVLTLKECHLVHPWFIEALEVARTWWDRQGISAYHPHRNSGTLRTLTLREGKRTGDRLVMLTVAGYDEQGLTDEQVQDFVQQITSVVQPRGIVLRKQFVKKGQPTFFEQEVVFGEDWLEEKLYLSYGEKNELSFRVGSTSFFQPNVDQAEQIYAMAIQMLELEKEQVVYDLFCGTGTLGICAAKYVKEVVGIEIVVEAVENARQNAERNGLANYRALVGDVKKLVGELPTPDVVMVDPPRSGLERETLEMLASWKTNKIMYISCNPYTQVEDCHFLVERGYHIKVIQPVDQFPQTYHLENLVLLERS